MTSKEAEVIYKRGIHHESQSNVSKTGGPCFARQGVSAENLEIKTSGDARASTGFLYVKPYIIIV